MLTVSPNQNILTRSVPGTHHHLFYIYFPHTRKISFDPLQKKVPLRNNSLLLKLKKVWWEREAVNLLK